MRDVARKKTAKYCSSKVRGQAMIAAFKYADTCMHTGYLLGLFRPVKVVSQLPED